VVHNLVISNVPGPPVPLYFMGAEITALYPLGPIMHGAGLNVTVMSNNGEMHVGVIACRESMPDVDSLVRHFPAELDRLKKAVAAGDPATSVTKGSAKAAEKS
jgi:diacylglycerol O-acyltransferase